MLSDEIKLAPMWRRFLSFISDVALWTISYFVFSIPFRRYGIYNNQKDYLIMLWCFLFLLYQSIIITKNKGRTIGGVWFRTKVISERNEKVPLLLAIFRSFLIISFLITIYVNDYLFMGITILILILIVPLFKPFKQLNQFIWDKFSKTYVIYLSVEDESKLDKTV